MSAVRGLRIRGPRHGYAKDHLVDHLARKAFAKTQKG